MPVPKPRPGTPLDWLARAKSNLALAQSNKTKETFWEDLCFQAQQAAEKALKAVLQDQSISFRYVHDLEELITTLENNRVHIPRQVKASVILTEYAVETRYPGAYEAVTRQDHTKAIRLAQNVVRWAEKMILS